MRNMEIQCDILYKAKKVPTERALSYNIFKSSLLDMTASTVDTDVKSREELKMPENFGFEVPSED